MHSMCVSPKLDRRLGRDGAVMRFTRNRKIAVGVVSLVAVAGLAYGYWTGTGSGTGTGTAGTSGTATITGTIASGVAPGENRAVSFTAANASGSPIQVSTVHVVSIAADSGHASCTTADLTMADVTENHQVPAGATVEPLPTNGSLVYANTAVNQDACKGATLTLTLSSS
jgi:hypothetical protein